MGHKVTWVLWSSTFDMLFDDAKWCHIINVQFLVVLIDERMSNRFNRWIIFPTKWRAKWATRWGLSINHEPRRWTHLEEYIYSNGWFNHNLVIYCSAIFVQSMVAQSCRKNWWIMIGNYYWTWILAWVQDRAWQKKKLRYWPKPTNTYIVTVQPCFCHHWSILTVNSSSFASFFKVTLWFPKWRSLTPWKGHCHRSFHEVTTWWWLFYFWVIILVDGFTF